MLCSVTESDGFDREGNDGGRQTPCSNPEKHAFNEDDGRERLLSLPVKEMVSDLAPMESSIKMRTPGKYYTVASNAASKKNKVLFKHDPVCLIKQLPEYSGK
jgi:hypothetical protein